MEFSVERYHSMIKSKVLGPSDRVELLRGKIVPMSPVGRLHAACVLGFSEILYPKFLGIYTLRSQDPVTILPLSEPEPDFVVARYDPHRYAGGHPQPADIHLIVEVSDSTLEKDRNYKLGIYAESKIAEYWIVNLVDRQFEVYTNANASGTYTDRTIYQEGSSFEHPLLGTIVIGEFLPPHVVINSD